MRHQGEDETHREAILYCPCKIGIGLNIAFVTPERLKRMDVDHSPVAGAPALALEVISAGILAQGTVRKVRQYLAAGCQSVWLVYPALRLVEIHDAAGARDLTEPESIREEKMFPGYKFVLELAAIFDDEFQHKIPNRPACRALDS